jgi:hypothetical protein
VGRRRRPQTGIRARGISSEGLRLNPFLNIWSAYRRHGRGSASALARYYVAKGRAVLTGPGRRCPICGWSGREFHPFVVVKSGLWRTKAACPACGSLERHRALFFAYGEYFRSHPTPGRILHLAPERCFRRLFHSRSAQYITSNYDREPSDLRLDVTRLGVRSGAIDLVVANGVMSYAGDHREAVDNLFRVLAPGGVALLCDIVNPEGRSGERPPEGHGQLRHFGGRDLAQKFTPFTANLIDVRTFVPPADHERFGIRRDDFYLIRLDKPLNGGTPA